MTKEITQFDALRAEITTAVQPAMAVEITDPETAETAVANITQLAKLNRAIEAKRKELVKPLNDQVKDINAYAKGIQEPVVKATAHVKGEIARWETKLAEARRIEAEKLERERREREERERQERHRREREEEERRRKDREAMEARHRAEAAKNAEIEAMQAKERARMEAQQARERERQRAEAERKRKAQEREATRRQKEIDAQRVKNTARVWKFEIEAPKYVPRSFCSPDPQLIRQAVKDGRRMIPGVKIWDEVQVRVRT